MSTIRKAEPATDDPHIGVEIEFDVQSEQDIDGLNTKLQSIHSSARVDAEIITYKFEKRTGYEFTICIQMLRYKQYLSACLQQLRQCKAFVDDRCGLHVHLDARVAPAAALRNNVEQQFDVLKQHMNEYRRNNPSSYDNLGVWSKRRYSTVEVRFMQSSLDEQTITAYIDDLLEISDLLALHRAGRFP